MEKDFEHIGDALRKAIEKNSHIKQKMDELQLKEQIRSILGDALMNHISEIKIQQQAVVISTPHTVLRQEIVMQKHNLLQRINELLVTPYFTEIILKSE